MMSVRWTHRCSFHSQIVKIEFKFHFLNSIRGAGIGAGAAMSEPETKKQSVSDDVDENPVREEMYVGIEVESYPPADPSTVVISKAEYDRLTQVRDAAEYRFGICENLQCDDVICLRRTTIYVHWNGENIYTSTLTKCTWCARQVCIRCSELIEGYSVCRGCVPQYKLYKGLVSDNVE